MFNVVCLMIIFVYVTFIHLQCRAETIDQITDQQKNYSDNRGNVFLVLQ